MTSIHRLQRNEVRQPDVTGTNCRVQGHELLSGIEGVGNLLGRRGRLRVLDLLPTVSLSSGPLLEINVHTAATYGYAQALGLSTPLQSRRRFDSSCVTAPRTAT